ncbi:WGR domain-containing protein [Rhizobium sp. LjRoot30]|uniref:WGR domain-containing protein n=1 Tax=Rhizobium sp. LjRoot30 TaxID=3342320 RepID=UPI003F501E3A
MATHKFNLHCRRIDETQGMRRYYALSLRETLFGEFAVTRCWGRIGRNGCEQTDLFCSEQDAVRHFLELARLKRTKGYRPVSASNRSNETAVTG